MLGLNRLFRAISGLLKGHRAKIVQEFMPYALQAAQILAGMAIDHSPEAIAAARTRILDLAKTLSVDFAKDVFLDDDGDVRTEVVENMPVRDLKGWLGKLLLAEMLVKAGVKLPSDGVVGFLDTVLQLAYERIHD